MSKKQRWEVMMCPMCKEKLNPVHPGVMAVCSCPNRASYDACPQGYHRYLWTVEMPVLYEEES